MLFYFLEKKKEFYAKEKIVLGVGSRMFWDLNYY